MAEEIKEQEGKNHHYGGGNRNAIAYGILQGHGYNTEGMSPAEAWALVSELNLMENRRWKRTSEDKKDIKEKKNALKAQGETKSTIEQKAQKIAKVVKLDGTGNTAAIKEAVDTIDKIKGEYKLQNLQRIEVKPLSNGTMAQMVVNVGQKLARNPNAAYRICVGEYHSELDTAINQWQDVLNMATDAKQQLRAQKTLDNLKEARKYSRHNVVYQGQEMESVITHEMGHVIAGQNFGYAKYGVSSSKALTEISDSYNESKANGDIYKISAYAAKSVDEYWAECFTMYKMGKETMPTKIKTMVEGILKNYV